uniref:Uncharacterized protein n=1 Tax=Lactuca sativa TaxID=4236 RepID=A0A9R1W3Y4_LACSA|nr:hypothetical protein LSAT_V11C300119980 [Lactuca sativa]
MSLPPSPPSSTVNTRIVVLPSPLYVSTIRHISPRTIKTLNLNFFTAATTYVPPNIDHIKLSSIQRFSLSLSLSVLLLQRNIFSKSMVISLHFIIFVIL